jgi:Lrp/AsnC family transcriptional regulator
MLFLGKIWCFFIFIDLKLAKFLSYYSSFKNYFFMAHERLDKLDLKILAILQEDATQSIGQLAETVGLSTTPCWKRIQKLEATGMIRKRVALLNAPGLGLGLTAFISIKTNQHKIEWFDSFHRVVSAIPEVVEIYRVTGNTDYLLKVVLSSMEDYDRVYKILIKGVDLADVSSMFAMEQIKYTTALPLVQIRRD